MIDYLIKAQYHTLKLALCHARVSSTKVEVFVDKEVRETRQTERGNTCSGATKKCEISHTLLSIN